jgi:flagella basal body P-ring formation protein FlgA
MGTVLLLLALAMPEVVAPVAPQTVAIQPPVSVSAPLDETRARAAITGLIERERRLATVTLLSIELPERVLLPSDEYEVQAALPAGGLRAGKQRIPLTVRFADHTEKRLTATVALQIDGPTLVPVRDVARGERLRPSDVRQEIRAFPPGEPLLRTLPSGAVARNPLRAGVPVAARNVVRAAPVEAGQKVRALLKNGDVQLQIDTVARNRGEIGALVTVAGADGRPLQARVIGYAEVEIVTSKEQK